MKRMILLLLALLLSVGCAVRIQSEGVALPQEAAPVLTMSVGSAGALEDAPVLTVPAKTICNRTRPGDGPALDEAGLNIRELPLVYPADGGDPMVREITDVLKSPSGVQITVHRTTPEASPAYLAAWLLMSERSAVPAGETAPVTVKVS